MVDINSALIILQQKGCLLESPQPAGRYTFHFISYIQLTIRCLEHTLYIKLVSTHTHT